MEYSRRALVTAAHEHGFLQVTERQITEWVRLGLLDSAVRSQRTDGRKGAYYVWSENQKSLLLTLLGKWEDVGRTSALVVIPVSIWLYWGDEWVPTKQTRKALRTSVDLFGPPHSWERAEANARDIVKALVSKSASREKVKRLTDSLTSGMFNKELDRAEVSVQLADLLESDPGQGALSQIGYDLEAILDLLLATVTAIDRLDALTDQDLKDARILQRHKVLAYAADFPRLPKSPTLSYEKVTLKFLVERSCRDLLFQLGLMILKRDRGETLIPPQNLNWKSPPLELIDWLQDRI